jgi:salicylate hydroxylase
MPLDGRDWVLIHRARLLEVLADAVRAAGVRVETGSGVASVADGAAAAGLTGTDGSVVGAGLVVGADGLNGRVRDMLGQAAATRFTGQVAWRAIVPGGGSAVAEVHMAAGRHVVTYPLAGGSRNLVAIEARRDWTEEGWSITGDAEELRRRFSGFSRRVAEMLEAVDQVHLWGLHHHPVARRWFGQRVVLVGDSAHPTLPFLAQGANMALEDAWVLAACLAQDTPPAAFARYQQTRTARVTRAIAAANANARAYHLRGLPRWAAHRALRLGGLVWPAGPLRRFEWLHGHNVTAGQ